MRAVAQRVKRARVVVDGEVVGAIDAGLLVYLGAAQADTDADVTYTAQKLAGLRIFEGDDGKISLSVTDIQGGILVVPQFTLFGDVRSGRRPSFEGAAPPDEANQRFEQTVTELKKTGLAVATGRFRAMMDVESVVAGPFTILIDSRKLF
jgi:D-tyrosyl-tRNA(Tyr) deacylase